MLEAFAAAPPGARRFDAAVARQRRLNAARISVSIADCNVAGSSRRCLKTTASSDVLPSKEEAPGSARSEEAPPAVMKRLALP